MNEMHTLTVNNSVSSNSTCRGSDANNASFYFDLCNWPPAPMVYGQVALCTQTPTGGSPMGWGVLTSGISILGRDREGGHTSQEERDSQVVSSSGSIAFAALPSLLVQSWKCDVFKLVFIETNVRRGESS